MFYNKKRTKEKKTRKLPCLYPEIIPNFKLNLEMGQ